MVLTCSSDPPTFVLVILTGQGTFGEDASFPGAETVNSPRTPA